MVVVRLICVHQNLRTFQIPIVRLSCTCSYTVISDVAHLEKTFTVPASIDAGQIPLNEVVKSNKHVVHRGQAHLFVDAEITCQSNIKSPVNQIILFVMREYIS